MTDVPNDPAKVLEIAIANEEQGYKILCDARDACEDKLAKATCDFLAKEELKHIDIIRKYASTGQPEALSAGAALSRKRIAEGIKGIFEQFGWQYQQVATEHEARLEAYRTAMEMERHGQLFYAEAAKTSKDEQAKKFYEFLAAEEIRHFELLQESHDFFQQPDAMLAMEEGWMQT